MFKQKVKLGESLVFENLTPGKYTARLVVDTNNDEFEKIINCGKRPNWRGNQQDLTFIIKVGGGI